MKTYTAIIRIKTNIEAAAEECNVIFGSGGHPDADRQEHFFALGCTPIQGDGYCRVIVAEHVAIGLQYLVDAGEVSENVDVIKVEWEGPEPFEIGQTEEMTDEEGNVIPSQTVYLGGFA